MPTTYTSTPALASACTASTVATRSTQLSAMPPTAGSQQFSMSGGHCPTMLTMHWSASQLRSGLQFGAPSVARITARGPSTSSTSGKRASSVALTGVPPNGSMSIASLNALGLAPIFGL
jgi:hypothetical protein